MEVTHYQLLTDQSAEHLAKEVQNAVSNGWQPWEAPGITHSGSQRYFIQAVVKYKKDLK
jgi:hypothetical protein